MTLSLKTCCSILLSCAFVFSTSVYSKGIYKWTDENGKVHYGERTPHEHRERSEKIKSRYYADDEAKQPQLPIVTPKQENKEVAQTTKAEPIKKDRAACESAKKDQQTLRSKPVVRDSTGKVMSVKQKNQQLKNLQDIISVNC